MYVFMVFCYWVAFLIAFVRFCFYLATSNLVIGFDNS